MICLRLVRAARPLAALSSVSVWAVAVALSFSSLSPVCAADSLLAGTLDTSFAPIVNRVTVYAVAVDGKGRVAYGGDSHTFARLTDHGTPDPGFSFSDFGRENRIVYALAVDREDRIYTAGAFDPSNSNRKSVNITRFFSDGSRINRGFDAGTGANQAIVAVLLQPTSVAADDDKVIIGGQFTSFDGSDRHRIARLNADGSLDDSFDGDLDIDSDVYALALQKSPGTGVPNGQIVIGGGFVKVNGAGHSKLVRVNFDGSVDESFAPSVDDAIFAIDTQPDGKIVIGGQFASVDGHRANGLARLNQDGSFDETFSAAISENENQGKPPTAVYALRLQADGRVVVAGNFLRLNGVERRFLGRLNPDGSVDESFDPAEIIANRVEALAIQPDNKIVVGQVVSKRVEENYPNVVKRVYGDAVPAAVPAVSILGLKKVVEGGGKGFFRVYRDDAVGLAEPLTIFYGTKNNGVRPRPGVDYRALSGVVTIPAGARSAKIKVTPLDSTLAVDGDRLKLKLAPNAGYKIEGAGTASIRFENGPAD